MKRDWMQTGRKPSGVCGAALYISALSHGFGCTRADVVGIVHICEATLTKRLIEFENTESGSLTVKMTREKVKLTNEKMVEDGGACSQNGDNATGLRYKNTASIDVDTENRNQDGQNGVTESCLSEAAIGCPAETDDWTQLQFQESYNVGDDMGEELETLSDIDDEEVDRYLHNEEEVRLKTIIWTEMNKEYLEEQATKEEAIAAAEAAHAAALAAAAEGAPDAVELAAAAAAAVARLKKVATLSLLLATNINSRNILL
ncbi:transcription factor IIIB 60 kDa subunit [Cryptomeria japonica]|uniref:transcription factor IIIB 60 kDa subunit n=1 Tax=Cryptomeria japonica TaxID=3369 RepID=UPI0027DAA42C|nr:transcription factor IIIB 60 kDa subunit [Cryptomeria japonica]